MGGIPARRKDTIFWRQELCRSNLSIGSWLSNVSLRSLRTIVFHDHLFMFAEAIKWWKPNLIAPSKEFQYNLSCLQTLAIFWLDMQWGGELKQNKSALFVVLSAITQQSARSSCQFFFLFVLVLLNSVIQCWSYHSYIFARPAEDLALNWKSWAFRCKVFWVLVHFWLRKYTCCFVQSFLIKVSLKARSKFSKHLLTFFYLFPFVLFSYIYIAFENKRDNL